MGVMIDAEVLRVQKALVSRDTAIIKAVIAQIELEQAQAPVLDEAAQTLSFRGKSVRLNENEYRFVHYLGCERLGDEVPFRDLDGALGVAIGNGYLTPKYSCHIASAVRRILRHLGLKPYGVLQTDRYMGTYRWHSGTRLVINRRWGEQPSA